MYAKSLIVFALCTIFVLAFALVLDYEAGNVGNQGTTIPTSQASCAQTATSCDTILITSTSLQVVNYTDELGTVTYGNLSVAFTPDGPSPVTNIALYFGNATSTTKVFVAQGTFQPGTSRTFTLTLPSSVTVYSGKTYLVSIEGTYGANLGVSATTSVTAQ